MINWEKQNESPWSDRTGKEFYSYPNSTVLPYVQVTAENIRTAPKPLWITDMHPDDPIGKVVTTQEGTYWIDLVFSDLTAYLHSLDSKYRKKFDKNLQANADLEIVQDASGIIDVVWGHYVDRLNFLAKKNGAEDYTEDELVFRYNFYTSPGMRTLAMVDPAGATEQERILAVNVSLWKEGIIYDLACMINPSPKSLPRSLGTFAILRNIEEAIRQKSIRYDLLANNYGYKTSFGATEHKLKAVVAADRDFFEYYNIPLELQWTV